MVSEMLEERLTAALLASMREGNENILRRARGEPTDNRAFHDLIRALQESLNTPVPG